MSSLDLGVIGNGTYGALIDKWARIVWCCLPRMDGDPVFHDLLNGAPPQPQDGAPDDSGVGHGFWSVEIENPASARQYYRENTAILVTELTDRDGNVVEICDFAPRFTRRERIFQPMTLVRRVRPVVGSPRIRVRLRPEFQLRRRDADGHARQSSCALLSQRLRHAAVDQRTPDLSPR